MKFHESDLTPKSGIRMEGLFLLGKNTNTVVIKVILTHAESGGGIPQIRY